MEMDCVCEGSVAVEGERDMVMRCVCEGSVAVAWGKKHGDGACMQGFSGRSISFFYLGYRFSNKVTKLARAAPSCVLPQRGR